MADSRTSASVVIVDPVKAAEERDRLARAQLNDTNPGAKPMFVASGVEHTVPFTVKVVFPDGIAKEKIEADVSGVLRDVFGLVDKHLNNFNPASEISIVNQLPAHIIHQMSPALAAVVHCSLSVFANARGHFDIACGPAANFAKTFLQQPSNAGKDYQSDPQFVELLAISSLSGGFKFHDGDHTLEKRDARAYLDLGGVSKGYGVDAVIERLAVLGYQDTFFDWGGDCRGSGRNALGEKWAVAVLRPPPMKDLLPVQDKSRVSNLKPDAPLIRVCHLDNEALATSGDYENLFQGNDGQLYSTQWSTSTKRFLTPSQKHISQATVKCFTAMYADALATATLHMHFFAPVRMIMDHWRWKRNAVTDYTMFVRDGERVSKMQELSKESVEMRQKRISDTLPARVVIVGGGLAGLCAAIEAASCGAQVILLEKSTRLGGNSAKATSGINGWGSRTQAKQGVIDGDKFFERDTYLSGLGGTCDPGLVKLLSVKSGEAIHWLSSFGIPLTVLSQLGGHSRKRCHRAPDLKDGTKKKKSGEAIHWLSSFGIPLTVLSQLGGHSRKRCHRAPDLKDGTPVPIGYTIMKTLEAYIRSQLSRQVTIMTESAVTSLIRQIIPLPDNTQRIKVLGVTFRPKNAEEDVTVYSDAVILATGGFSNDQTTGSLMREFAPHLFGQPTTNGPFATGDGVKMARSIGAQLIDMDKVQLHPTGFVDPKDPANPTKFLGPEALRGSGGILINAFGERFVNELDLRSVVSAAINEQNTEYPNSNGCKVAFCVLNAEAAKLFGINALQFYWKKQGLFSFVDDTDQLAKLIGCPLDTLRATLAAYQHTSSAKTAPCPTTGKRVFPCVIGNEGPYYVAVITPSIHYTMGGCLISPAAEVQSEFITTSIFGSRRPIQGLFGAGEVTAGVHGENRLGGNSLLECVVFGRIAGDRAATILQKKPHALSQDQWSPLILREIREGADFGQGSRILRFNLPGATQNSGLKLGQFVAIRGEWDGQHLVGYYSPITLPDDHGVIGILVRVDKGTLKDWLTAMRPGDAIEMRACGGLAIDRIPSLRQLQFRKEPIHKITMIAGGTGVAPMIQIIRAALKRPYIDRMQSLDLIYAAEDYSELTYRTIFEKYQNEHRDRFHLTLVLNNPPPRWTGGVGFVDKGILSTYVPAPSKDLLIVICGPPMMQRVTKSTLISMGHVARHVRTVDEDSGPSKL
ncbi:NADH-dependent fumarate reductase, putative [Bodo saltans]|uniref:fumarate reductase (NADH) n=1 Tax=Bodo saltans TaxID=75058 RepID=A0A0S4IZL1_BODSA|nr:NADH-dependent fumarate reductase, putative [Bodo saltans]|eukprot:CUG28369.1 NADH-dependent fumarate reductase, putative [Bodo saltans]